MMVKLFNRLDFEACRDAVTNSALVSSGQAEGMRRVADTMTEHRKVLQILANPLLPAPERTLHYQVLVGCDFITPFSYKKRPKCAFCGKRRITTSHIVLECPETALDGSDIAVVKNIISSVECPLEIREILENTEDTNDLFYYVLGVFDACILERHKHFINKMLKITTNHLASLKRAWADITLPAS